MDIRKKTALIIRKDGEFLQGRIMDSKLYRWSISPWDAWMTRSREKARNMQAENGGEIMLWNPIAGQLREARL